MSVQDMDLDKKKRRVRILFVCTARHWSWGRPPSFLESKKIHIAYNLPKYIADFHTKEDSS